MENLIKVGANVTVISPDLNEPMAALKAEGRFRHIQREYQPGDLEGYTLAFVATDDRAVNSTVADEGKARGVWVNAVDDPPYCDFIMPGIVQRGDLVIAISTSGRSPAMARKMREELTDFLSEEWVAMLELAAEVRAELRTRDIMVDSDTWNAALDDELRHLLRENRYDEAKQRLLRNLRQPVSGP
jgi:precorrin-2 dehydrogenase/sirohydrochlorin ferrochelatase